MLDNIQDLDFKFWRMNSGGIYQFYVRWTHYICWSEVRFASFLSSAIVVLNPLEIKLAKRIFVHWSESNRKKPCKSHLCAFLKNNS